MSSPPTRYHDLAKSLQFQCVGL
ncbi:hypothetical protein D049_1287A, partial [Vibrio parahaemolyticus VPTS-2010]